jgi:hypothetical protein
MWVSEQGNDPAPVWYRAPVLNIILTYLTELTAFHIYKERPYAYQIGEETYSRDGITL